MAIGNIARLRAVAQRELVTSRSTGPKRDPYVRPYTQFERGGIYRFRSAEMVFRPFRVA